MKNTRFSLDGVWNLAYVSNSRFIADKPQINRIKAIGDTGYPIIDASVPGNFELDFQRAGIIGDPFRASNILELQKLENLHLFYFRYFDYDGDEGDNTYLCFEGIDTYADIFVNGKKIGMTDNMLIPHNFRGANIRSGRNEIIIHILPAAIVARKHSVPVSSNAMKHNWDSLYVRKAPHMYGWDIMPRALSGGIWRSAYIEARTQNRIDDIFFYTKNADISSDSAECAMVYNITAAEDDISRYTVRVRGICGDSIFTAAPDRLWFTSGSLDFCIQNVKLWMPRGYGEPNLYAITAELLLDGESVFTYDFTAGIRTVVLERTSTAGSHGEGEFLFRVNGQRVFVMGTNWVPVDAFHSRDKERLPSILPMLCDIGCNAVRCWGGNVYEDDIFYNFCDANGIMVWQDFAMACAIYPQDEYFCGLIAAEVEAVVRRLRGHASIILWAGDNECDESYRWSSGSIKRNPNDNVITRRIIPDVLNIHDFTRPYLPSSPYVDNEAFACGEPISEDHLWGPRDYFKGDYYKNTVCHFASETGYHGCPSPVSMTKFIRPEMLWHWQTGDGKPKQDWAVHAACMEYSNDSPFIYRIKLMSDQVKTLFGDEGDTLEEFALRSQISQAEAKKYFIERFRISKWRRTGIIWWNLIDGWPQISDAVVDYYGTKKLAYSYIKRSQSPVCFMFDEPELGGTRIALYGVNDTGLSATVRYTVRDLTDDRLVTFGECTLAPHSSQRVCDKYIEKDEKHFYAVTWTDGNDNSPSYLREGINHYMTNIREINADEYIGYMKIIGYDGYLEGFSDYGSSTKES